MATLKDQPLPAVVRPMRAGDVDRVVELEKGAFAAPWKPQTFRRLLDDPAVVLLVAESEGRVAGYTVAWCVLDQAELANVAVAPEVRRRGVGRRLVREAVETVRARGVRRIYLEVRESNASARALYSSEGFEIVGRREAYYDQPSEDALVLLKHVTPSTDEDG